MNILITGGAGYIGSHIIKNLLLNREDKITVIDNLSTGFRETIESLKALDREYRLEFIELDLSNYLELEQIFQEREFDSIIHFAASLVVPESIENPLKYYLNNSVNTTKLIDLAIKYSIENFIFSSTAAVYGEPDISEIPAKESNKLEPINPYGYSKLISERVLIDSARANSNFKYVILRYFNVAGADVEGRIGQSTKGATHLIKVASEVALKKRERIYIFGDDYRTSDGTCIRDYIHVDDLAIAHIKALEYISDSRNSSNIFNCGYGDGFSVREILDTMKRVSGVDFGTKVTKRREGDPAILICDNSKIVKELKWTPKYNDIELICKSALNWESKLN